MELPPEQLDEPEWLQVQRANKRKDRNFATSLVWGKAALALLLIPMLGLYGGDLRGRALFALYWGIIFLITMLVFRRRNEVGSTGRYAANYVAVISGMFASGGLAAALASLL
jgi:hypothetical protein